MVVRDVRDVCFYSYFSVMDDLREKGPPNRKYYEIRCFHCMPLSVCLYYHVSEAFLIAHAVAWAMNIYLLIMSITSKKLILS